MREIELKSKEIEELKSEIDSLIQDKSKILQNTISRDKKGSKEIEELKSTHIKCEKVSEQQQDNVCKVCGKKCIFVGKAWKQMCNMCRKRKYSDARNDKKRTKRKKVGKTVPGPSSINLRYMDESELLDRSKVVRKSNKVMYVQNRRLLNKVENYEKKLMLFRTGTDMYEMMRRALDGAKDNREEYTKSLIEAMVKL